MFCPNCNAENPDSGAFCVGCGQSLQAAPAPAQYAAPEVDETQDAQDNKVMGILSYLGILCLVPFFTKKDSPFAMFHSKQGVNLCLLWVANYILSLILGLIKFTTTEYYWGVGVEVKKTPWFITMITSVIFIGIAVLAVIGIINAVKGEKKELPLIGGIQIIK